MVVIDNNSTDEMARVLERARERSHGRLRVGFERGQGVSNGTWTDETVACAS